MTVGNFQDNCFGRWAPLRKGREGASDKGRPGPLLGEGVGPREESHVPSSDGIPRGGVLCEGHRKQANSPPVL